MRRRKGELRVFKLRSGEEIIATVAGKTKERIKLQRPMRIVENLVADPYSGLKKSVVFFTDWLGSTNELVAEIPLDFIVADLHPDPDMESLYGKQMSAVTDSTVTDLDVPLSGDLGDFLKDIVDSKSGGITEEEMKKLNDAIQEELNSALKDFYNESKPTLPPAKPEDINKLPHGYGAMFGDMMKPFGNSGPAPKLPPFGLGLPPLPSNPIPRSYNIPNSILFSMNIPNDILMSWANSGFLDYLKDCIKDFVNVDFLDEMLEEMNPKRPSKKKSKKKKPSLKEKLSDKNWTEPTDSRKKETDYGNRPEDWSSFVKDYIQPKEPPTKDGSGGEEPPKNT